MKVLDCYNKHVYLLKAYHKDTTFIEFKMFSEQLVKFHYACVIAYKHISRKVVFKRLKLFVLFKYACPIFKMHHKERKDRKLRWNFLIVSFFFFQIRCKSVLFS